MNGTGRSPDCAISLGIAEVRLPVREVSGVDDVEATASVEQDALEREFVVGAEELDLGGEIDAHAVVAARCLRIGQRDGAALVQGVEIGHGEVERRDAQPVGEHGTARFGQA